MVGKRAEETMNEVEGQEGEGATLSESDGVQGVPPQLDDDDINLKEDRTKAVVDESDVPGQDELPGSELEEASIQQPLSAEGEKPLSAEGEKGDGEEATASSEQGLRYANPYGTFITGIDVNSEEAALKRSQRAARFGLSREEGEGGGGGEGGREAVEKRQARAKRFGGKLLTHEGQPIKLMDKLPEVPSGDLRPGVLHLHGTDELSTADVFGYFQAYPPRNIEWINDSSCNAVWEDAESASRALRGLSDQPVALRSKFTEEAPQPMETSSDLSGSPSSPSTLRSPPHTAPAEQPEVKVQWHLGVSHPKANQVLLLRCAVEGDVKVSGAAQRSNYYRKYGNPNKRVGSPAGGSRGGSGAGGRTWREKPAATDLRQRLGKRDRAEDGGVDEGMELEEEEESEVDLLARLVKRPKPLHSERRVEEIQYLEDSEKERLGSEVTEVTGADLRRRIQKKRKKRELQLRVGVNPRIVERTS